MAETFKFLAGPARVLIFQGQNLIGVGKTATDTTFTPSITSEGIRGGAVNALLGQYFHDANLAVNVTYADFNLENMALTGGTSIISGGTTIAEEQLTAGAGGAITLSNTAVAVDGAIIGWYKRPSDNDWTVNTINGNTMTISGAAQGDVYCVKYFYVDNDARSMVLRADYVPSVVHLVLIANEYAGVSTDIGAATTYGKLVVDIPAFQLAGGQELSLSAGSAATTSLSGNALAIDQGTSCDESLVFGTITEKVNGAVWQNDVLSIAPEDGDIELAQGESETLAVRVIFKGLMAAQRKANSNFTFAIENTPASTATGTTVSNQGVVTAGSTNGTAVVSITLTGTNVPPAYAKVTVGA